MALGRRLFLERAPAVSAAGGALLVAPDRLRRELGYTPPYSYVAGDGW